MSISSAAGQRAAPGAIERIRIESAGNADVAATGAAHLVCETHLSREVPDSPMLGRNEIRAHLLAQLLEAVPVFIDCANKPRTVVLSGGIASPCGDSDQTLSQCGRPARGRNGPSPVLSHQIRRRCRPSGKNTRESYTFRQPD